MKINDKIMLVDEETGEILDDQDPGGLDILEHYGMPRRSGRYPWGSGDNPYQHGSADFLSRVEELEKEGKSESEIAAELGIVNYRGEPSPQRLRAQKSVAINYRRALQVERAKDLAAKGMGPTEIGKQLGINESTVRSLLNKKSEERMNTAVNLAGYLKEEIDKNGMLDVGVNVERNLGVTRTQLDKALMILEMEGYPTYGGRVKQPINPGQMTTLKVVGPPGTEKRDIYKYDQIHQLGDKKSQDGGQTFDPVWVYPKSLDSKRVAVRYAEDDGVKKDGLVELRRGVEDISLGGSKYAQVRILVDGTHYIKGMAVYSDDLPDGVDVLFNTNKHRGTPMLGPDKNHSVLKPIEDPEKNPDNPFGSLIKEGIDDPDKPSPVHGGQRYYYDKNGEKQLSVINKRADEGDWGEWSKELPSQFLSKQNIKLARQQLNLAKLDRQDEFEEICALTNPTVKKHLLGEFAKSCDKAAETLKAAALPRQKYQVIIPLLDISDNEIFAPNFHDGETVALIRYPHGGTFEIPILKVNNRNKEGLDILSPTPSDAVGINANVAARLSGADFDGDTVMVIPISGQAKITSTHPLRGLEGFDPKEVYGPSESRPEGSYKLMTKAGTQQEMGRISNLITDMTLTGRATEDELARAVRHSMVVIDAYKHKLDYKQSELDNDIQALKERYQKHTNENGNISYGAATIVSRASADYRAPKYPGMQKINPDTGELYWDPKKKPETYIDNKGRVQQRTITISKMANAKDANELVSEARHPVELIYAEYANSMKALANDARKEMVSTGRIKKNAEAVQKYVSERENLLAQLNVAELNAPRERQALLLANSRIKKLTDEYPELKDKNHKSELKKLNQREVSKARAETGAKRNRIDISEKQWEMIMEGGVSENELTKILKYTDGATIRKYATPKREKQVSVTKQNHIKALQASGYTTDEIAQALDLSTSTVQKYLN